MTMATDPEPRAPAGFRWLTGLAIFWALFLIWVGAAVTTENVGMVVPDWPLSFGQINPEGWWQIMPVRLEHGHRWLGAIMGLIVLAMTAWLWLRERQPWWELLLLVVAFAAIVDVLRRGHYGLGAGIGLTTLVWLVIGWLRRDWTPLLKLTLLALFAVVLQSLKGGLRVVEVSNVMAIAHGWFAQAFFCLLLLIWLAAGRRWAAGLRPVLPDHGGGGLATGVRFGAMAVLVGTFLQLGLGATMRHTHRYGLAADDILTTGGYWVPGPNQFDLFIMFLHKWWAVALLLLVWAFTAWSWRRAPVLRVFTGTLSLLIGAQLALGVGVLWFGKTFWITNFHVINGLAILAVAFVLVVRIRHAGATSRRVAVTPGVGESDWHGRTHTG